MNDDTRYEHIYLSANGSIPGIPGDHAPGEYVIDWQERTIKPFGQAEPEAASEDPQTAEEGTTEKVQAISGPRPMKPELVLVDESMPHMPESEEGTTPTEPLAEPEQQPAEQPAEPAKPDVSAEISHLEEELHQLAADEQHAQ